MLLDGLHCQKRTCFVSHLLQLASDGCLSPLHAWHRCRSHNFSCRIPLDVVGCRLMMSAIVGYRWMLLVVGCCWPLAVEVVGCHWPLLAVVRYCMPCAQMSIKISLSGFWRAGAGGGGSVCVTVAVNKYSAVPTIDKQNTIPIIAHTSIQQHPTNIQRASKIEHIPEDSPQPTYLSLRAIRAPHG